MFIVLLIFISVLVFTDIRLTAVCNPLMGSGVKVKCCVMQCYKFPDCVHYSACKSNNY